MFSIINLISRPICFVTRRHSSVEIVGPAVIRRLNDVNEIMNKWIIVFAFVILIEVFTV